MQITRRGLITGLASCFVAAPAIVRASSLMAVKPITLASPNALEFNDFLLRRMNAINEALIYPPAGVGRHYEVLLQEQFNVLKGMLRPN